MFLKQLIGLVYLPLLMDSRKRANKKVKNKPEIKDQPSQIVDEWKKKCDDLAAELDAAQRDNRNLTTDLFKVEYLNF